MCQNRKKERTEVHSLMVELPRFELRITEPKSAVLPLHHSSIVARKRDKSNAKKSIGKIYLNLSAKNSFYTLFYDGIYYQGVTFIIGVKTIGEVGFIDFAIFLQQFHARVDVDVSAKRSHRAKL